MLFVQDLRFALRTLSKSPGFVAVVLLLLALGIGANTAIFSVVEAVLLRPLPYRAPDRLYMLFKAVPARHLDWDWTSYPTIRDWTEQSHSFEEIAFVLRPEGSLVTLTSGDQPETLQGSKISGNLFPLLGVPPLLGRTFAQSETRRGELTVVLSYRLWQQRFGGARDVPGRVLQIDHAPATIIGVMPESFRFPDRETQLWLPIPADTRWPSFQKFRVADAFGAVGRLKPGVQPGEARAEMAAIAGRLARQYPATDAGLAIRVLPLADRLTPPNTRRALWTLLGAVGCLLVMACLNVAGLVLTRGSARQRELAMRTALGASRGRLVAQLLTENLILSFAGGGLGLALAIASVHALLAIAPASLPGMGMDFGTVGVDAGLLAFAVSVSAFSGVAFGLAPALRLAGRAPQEILQGGGRGSSAGPGRSHSHAILVAAQFAVAVVLLAGSGLLMRSFLRIQAVQLGFDP